MSDDLPQGQAIQSNQPPQTDAVASQAQPVGTPHKEHVPPAVQVQVEVLSALPEAPVAQEQKEVHIESAPEQQEVMPSPEILPHSEIVSEEKPSYLPPPATQTPSNPLPMSYTDAVKKEKETKLVDSSHWLARLLQLLWKRRDPEIEKRKI